MNKENIKKNILDLQFQKNLIIASTSVIIAFTYGIGIGIAIITKQIKFNDFIIMGGNSLHNFCSGFGNLHGFLNKLCLSHKKYS